jgi:hypothetical protein
MFKPVTPTMNFVSEADPDFEKKASSEQLAAVERAKRTSKLSTTDAAKAAGMSEEIIAKYKIEVRFVNEVKLEGNKRKITKQRTVNGPNLCGISLWESGRRFHGGGDDLMFWCRDNRPGHNEGCWGHIASDNVRGPYAYCPHCGKTSVAELLTTTRIFRLSSQALASKIAEMFVRLGHNADIYVKYDKGDPRYETMVRERGWEVANRLKGMHIYLLKNILKDTANGADLTKRIYTFITS